MTSDAIGTERTRARDRSRRSILVVRVAPWIGAVEDVRWGAVWAGLATALGLFLLLSLLATAIGATVVENTAVGIPTVSRVTGVVTAAIVLGAFFAGGLISGRTGGSSRAQAGALHGFLLWAVAVLIALGLASLGLGALLGGIGIGVDAIRQIGATDAQPTEAVAVLQRSSWITFISLALGATAATAGGWVGAETRTDDNDRGTDVQVASAPDQTS